MFLGHYGVAFAAKRLAPRASLGTLSFAAQFLDELWPVLLLLGFERARIAPGLMSANAIDFVSYPISHSLLGALAWAAMIGAGYVAITRDRRSAWIVAACVLSHWLLDVPMHRPDLPIWPGGPMVGLGIWQSIPLTIAVDGSVFLMGLVLYLRDTRAADRIGTWALWCMVAVLVLIFVSGIWSPPPSSERALALSALGLWLFVPWSAWIDRHRTRVGPATA
jgi:hypothetical protein